MRPRPLALAFGVAFAVSPAAWAQMQVTSASGPSMQLTSASAPSLESIAAGTGRQLTTSGLASGLKLGEEAILHAALYADLGYDTNVYYSAGSTSKPAAVLHIGPRLEITNAERDGTKPSGTYYDVFAGLDWRKYLTSDGSITQQDAINPSIGGTAEFSSNQALGFSLGDTFMRSQQAPWSSGPPITRDDNMAVAGLRYAPGGGRLRFNLRYTNLIDAYEGSFSNGSNMGNEIMLDAGWRFLPRTSVYAQVAQGVITYFSSGRVTSYPLRTLVGMRGLLTAKLSLNLAAGYSNAFYSSGDTPSGFGNVGIVTEVNYQIDLLSRLGIGYHHDFANSPFVGQFYNMDAIYGAYQQMIASRVVAYLYGRYENRRFGGLATPGESRTDNYLMGGVSVDYMIGHFFLIGASYSLNFNRSSLTTGADAGVDYAKQVILFRLGVVY
jgi:hypothetical protein